MTRGVTLLELLVALSLIGILAGVAVASAVATRDRLLVALHARHLAAAHADTRWSAIRAGARAELTIGPTSYRLRQLTGDSFVVAWSRPGAAVDGVTLSGSPTPIIFDSRGYSLGVANRTYRLSRGASSIRVVISRLGRLRILP